MLVASDLARGGIGAYRKSFGNCLRIVNQLFGCDACAGVHCAWLYIIL
jgi:hypothetical protein